MKLYIYITDIPQYIKGDLDWCLMVSARGDLGDTTDWILAGSVDAKLIVDENNLRQQAVKNIEKEEEKARAEFQVKMDRFDIRKQNLLAISHDS